ncbi:hypothetical protein RJ639_017064 [Escallonia herrerae]|uniref:CSN8/PSMD8/EIF3K domain-containing protein n=1 Tax=Escallonia herrerae TaxID=1293975 RepID=A0AA88VE50_9ASTE|nr:hypothetical protein RJ639_017064 [Escallonia herrerae]
MRREQPQQEQEQEGGRRRWHTLWSSWWPSIPTILISCPISRITSTNRLHHKHIAWMRIYAFFASIRQFEPDRMSTQIVARILVKALMAMPAPDFSLCLFLISERVTARFRQFWDEATKNRHILEVVPGFEQAIQAYAVHVLSLTYQKIPRSILVEAINIEGLSLEKFLEHQLANCGWILEKGQGSDQLIVLPRSECNHPELKKSSADNVPLEHITRIFPILG